MSRYALMSSLQKRKICFFFQLAPNQQCIQQLLPAVISFCEIRVFLVEKVDLWSTSNLPLTVTFWQSLTSSHISSHYVWNTEGKTIHFGAKATSRSCSHNKVALSLFNLYLKVFTIPTSLSIHKQCSVRVKTCPRSHKSPFSFVLHWVFKGVRSWKRIG